MQRRDFFKGAAIGAAGWLAAGAPAMAQPQEEKTKAGPAGGRFVAGDDTIKVALVGCGFRGTGVAFPGRCA